MIKVQNTQSLTDFRANAMHTLERLNASGDSEIITVNGEAKAVLISPSVFDEFAKAFEVAETVAQMRKSMIQIEFGEYRDGFDALNEIRDRLVTMQVDQGN
ncbi:MAG: type II toxin-antitoxin system Phd/YefM family antitoxin [Thermosynechococcaceae cyanobacterium]